MELRGIKGIIFDSGKVLNAPKTGHWFISPNFYEYVDQEVLDGQDKEQVNKAFRKAYDNLCSKLLIKTREEEYKQFHKFYSIIGEELPDLLLNRKKIAEITKDLVYNDDKYVFYEDVFQVIPKLSERYSLGVLSDAWPSLLNVYEKANLRQYFKAFVVSALLGVAKPNPLMYQTALSKMEIESHEAVFIDDCPDNCRGASELGIRTLLLCRNKETMLHHDFEVITDLYQFMKMLDVAG